MNDFERGQRDFNEGRDELAGKLFFQLETIEERQYFYGWTSARGSGRFEPASTPGTSEQPAPQPNDHPAAWDLVLADIRERDAMGARRYGVRLQPHNGRDTLTDAYQEALDLVVYLRTALYERDGR